MSLFFMVPYFFSMQNLIKPLSSLTVLFFLILTAGSHAVHGNETGVMSGMVQAHNDVRAEHDVQPLAWSDEVAAHARQWAQYLAEENNCQMMHRPRSGQFARLYGENLYWASAILLSNGRRRPQQIHPAHVVANWAGESKNYSYRENSCAAGKSCGHYTQLVWKGSKTLGCGMAFCEDSSQIWVCNYDPPGNIIGQKPY